MVRYFYAWIPLVFVGTLFVLALPWLGLIALMIAALAGLTALAALASAIVLVPYTLGRAISRRWHGRGSAAPRTAAALAPVGLRTRTLPATAAVLLASPLSERENVS
jgi:hypothetical protein